MIDLCVKTLIPQQRAIQAAVSLATNGVYAVPYGEVIAILAVIVPHLLIWGEEIRASFIVGFRGCRCGSRARKS